MLAKFPFAGVVSFFMFRHDYLYRQADACLTGLITIYKLA